MKAYETKIITAAKNLLSIGSVVSDSSILKKLEESYSEEYWNMFIINHTMKERAYDLFEVTEKNGWPASDTIYELKKQVLRMIRVELLLNLFENYKEKVIIGWNNDGHLVYYTGYLADRDEDTGYMNHLGYVRLKTDRGLRTFDPRTIESIEFENRILKT